MKKHTKIYLKYFGYGENDFVPCELCGVRANDIHHITPRGMGGSKSKDFIDNLMALCRKHHDMAEARVYLPEDLRAAHLSFKEYFDTVGRNWHESPVFPPEFKIYPLLPSDCFIKTTKKNE